MGYPSFSAGDVLTATDMNAVGLWLIETKTVSAATSVSFESKFSSTYDFYKITGRLTAASGTLTFVLLNGTTERTASTYYTAGFDIAAIVGTLNAKVDNGAAAANIFSNSMSAGAAFTMDFSYGGSSYYSSWSHAGTLIGNGTTEQRSGAYHTAIAHDGIKFKSSANMTGTFRLYGYRN